MIHIPCARSADSCGWLGGAAGHATPGGSGGRANVSEGGTDLPDNNTTTGEVDVGGSVTGNIDRALDRDWFKVELEADKRYQIDVEGKDTGRGNLADPAATLHDVMGANLNVGGSSVGDDDSGVGKNAQMIYTPTAGGTVYAQVNDPRALTGNYRLSVIVLGANGVSEADTDFNNTTHGRVELKERRQLLDSADTIATFAEEMSEFLKTSELTETRAFVHSFVKEVVVKPGRAAIVYSIPTPDDSPMGGADAAEIALNGRVKNSVQSGGPEASRRWMALGGQVEPPRMGGPSGHLHLRELRQIPRRGT